MLDAPSGRAGTISGTVLSHSEKQLRSI